MSTPQVQMDTWPGLLLPKEEIRASLQYLAHKTRKAVTFAKYARDEGYGEDSVSVRVYVCNDRDCTYFPSHVALDGQKHSMAPGQRGMAAALVHPEWKKITDEEGQLIGCVDRNRVILPLEITAADNPAARAILAHVVEQAIPLLDFDLGQLFEEQEESFRRSFSLAFRASVRNRLQVRRDEFDERKHEAERAFSTIIDFERERNVLEEEISRLSDLADKVEPPLCRVQAKELLRVRRSGLFAAVAMNDDGVLTATTGPVTIEHDGYLFPVGRYEIEIPANGDIRIRALDSHPNADHPHPHVARDGRPCLGNISADVARLVGKLRYAEVLQLLHSFLSSYCADNPYEKIGHFDPDGEYRDEGDDPCDDCDEKCSPYCIFDCEHNHDCFTCSDCCDLRTEHCFTECSHNEDYERFQPCDQCDRKATEYCYLRCQYNREWELQEACEACEAPECTGQSCPYFSRKEERAHAKAG